MSVSEIFEFELNQTTSTTTIANKLAIREPVTCISKSLLELHMKSVIDLTEYTYIRMKSDELPWYEIVIKIALCMLSIMSSFFGNVITIYNMLIKPKLKSSSTLKYDYYISDANGVSSVLHKSSIVKKTRDEQSINNQCMRSFSSEKGSAFKNNEKKIIVTKITRPKIKNKSVNFFILNLCFCDLMIVIWCSWVHMVNRLV